MRRFYYRLFQSLVRGKVVTKEIDGSNYKLDLGEKIDIALLLGEFEKDLVSAIKRDCRAGMTVLDIGANFGAHALLFGRLVGETGSVYCFEPTDYAYKKLNTNVGMNDRSNTQIFNIACSDSIRKETGVDFRSSWCTDGSRKDYPCTVHFVPLDEWIKDKKIENIDVLKLDVDGNEYSVLQGAKNTLKRYDPLIFLEVWGPNFKDPNRNPFLFLEELGYSFFSLDRATKYGSVDSLRELVCSESGELLDFSVNILAEKVNA